LRQRGARVNARYGTGSLAQAVIFEIDSGDNVDDTDITWAVSSRELNESSRGQLFLTLGLRQSARVMPLSNDMTMLQPRSVHGVFGPPLEADYPVHDAEANG
jgi:hypothetical protein